MNDEETTGQEEKRQRRQAIQEQRKGEVIEFGRDLRRRRKQAGLTQAATAAMVGVSTGYIALLEAGKRNVPRQATLVKMLRGYGVPRFARARLLEQAERLSNQEDWDLSEAQRGLESQVRIQRVPLHQLQALVAENLDQIEAGLSDVVEVLQTGEAIDGNDGVDLIASSGSAGMAFIAVQDVELHAASLARVLSRYDAYSDCHKWPAPQPTRDEAKSSLRLMVIAPKFGVEALEIAKYLALELKLVRWTALRQPGTEETRLLFKAIQFRSWFLSADP